MRLSRSGSSTSERRRCRPDYRDVSLTPKHTSAMRAPKQSSPGTRHLRSRAAGADRPISMSMTWDDGFKFANSLAIPWESKTIKRMLLLGDHFLYIGRSKNSLWTSRAYIYISYHVFGPALNATACSGCSIETSSSHGAKPEACNYRASDCTL